MKIFFLQRELTGFLGKLNKQEMIRKTEELFRNMGVSMDPKALVSELRTGEKQLLEIGKALMSGAKLLILDEPTTSLNNEEVANLFSIIRDLKNKGISFIFISHKMPEIFAYCDCYTVFRNGNFVGSGKLSETTPEKVTEQMVGHAGREKAAFMTGINVRLMKMMTFVIMGVLVGAAAVLWIAMNGSSDPATTGASYEMYAIAAVVLGGISMAGGKGKMVGVLFGSMSYTVIDKIIIALKMDSLINDAIKGLILILVILIQVAGPQLKEKMKQSFLYRAENV